jgi:hypothetical protein
MPARMSRPSIILTIILFCGMSLAPAFAAEVTTTAPATAPAATKPVARPLPELFRINLHDRRLDVGILPPRDVANAAVTASAIEGGEAAEPTTSSFEFNAVGEEKWQIAAFPRDRRKDGAYTTFNVSCDSRTDDHWSSLQLVSVSRDEQALTIAGGGRMGRGFVSVTYRQDAKLRDVRFTVQRPRRVRPRPLHEFAAQDLVQLFIEHQAELRQYLIPMLKEAYGQNPLRPHAGDVYRAFASIPADPVMIEKVRAILPDFDAAAAPAREAASAKIQSLGPAGILAAQRIDRSDLTPEQAARLDAIVAHDAIWPDPEAAAQKDAYFLVDCLQDADERVRTAALESLRTLKGSAIAFDVSASPAARAKAAEALYDKLDDERDTLPPEP